MTTNAARWKNNAERIPFTFEGKKSGSPRSPENVAPPRFPGGGAKSKPRFAFLPGRRSSALRPWQLLQRRNVLTRNDAQQSLEETESGGAASLSESAHPLPTSVFVGKPLFPIRAASFIERDKVRFFALSLSFFLFYSFLT